GLAILGALEAAHAAGITHRDVKPGNILLGHDGRVKLTDFGIARAAGDTTITGTGLLVGSPSYLAPEIVRGQEAGPAGDMWGLGATLYAAAEGRAPFSGVDAMDTLAKVVQDPPAPFDRSGPLIPALSAMLDKDPAHRASAVQARRLLLDVLRGGDAPAAAGAQPVGPGAVGGGTLSGALPPPGLPPLPGGAPGPASDAVPAARTPHPMPAVPAWPAGVDGGSQPFGRPEPARLPGLPGLAAAEAAVRARRQSQGEPEAWRSQAPPAPFLPALGGPHLDGPSRDGPGPGVDGPVAGSTEAGGPGAEADYPADYPAGETAEPADPQPAVAEAPAYAEAETVDAGGELLAAESAARAAGSAADAGPGGAAWPGGAGPEAGPGGGGPEGGHGGAAWGAGPEAGPGGGGPVGGPGGAAWPGGAGPEGGWAGGAPPPPSSSGPEAWAAEGPTMPWVPGAEPAAPADPGWQQYGAPAEARPDAWGPGGPGHGNSDSFPFGESGWADEGWTTGERWAGEQHGYRSPDDEPTQQVEVGSLNFGPGGGPGGGPAGGPGAGGGNYGGPPRRSADQARRRRAIIAVAAVVGLVLLVIVGGVLAAKAFFGGSDNPQANQTTVIQTTPPKPPGAAALPSGFVRYKHGGGFSVAVPAGWQPEVKPRGVVDVSDPGSSRFLRLIKSGGGDPLGQLTAAESSFQSGHENYARVRLGNVSYRNYPAADWEFTYTNGGVSRHVLYREFQVSGSTYAIYLSAPAAQWADSQRYFETAAATFTLG
ncbi:MAG: eukaryotic-like serine/threonine-protein kinase, partial [Mycobacteriales bacterium]